MFNNSVLFDDNNLLFEAMLKDIAEARTYIYLETYRIKEDEVGAKFREALETKCKEGVKVKILVDSWGIAVSPSYFTKIIQYGGQVRYFKKFKFFIDIFTKNHRRNHRKLLLIDDKITYIGSSNYTSYSLVWRESVLRIEGEITHYFNKIFRESFLIYKKYHFNKFSHKKIIKFGDFKIIQDIPSIYFQRIRKEFTHLINHARHEILIETPYFLPGFKLRKSLMDAANRGVDVKILVPKNSDVKLADILRNKYLGLFYKNNVNILFYTPNNLHAKCMLIDNEIFEIGSPNFDYRSFRYQYEIALFGNHDETNKAIRKHILETIKYCEVFDYHKWHSRPLIEKIFEWLMLPIRYLL
ncbi:MAG: phosphatidylserine/phosphatidylglycerophosphate/cardiolipin synthase family protein [Bacteroidetes bacterium]|nr:phosphatidylserine/phosphatidylglycerophosphate/cardiolipin synthase family protein [Bacteroidota bacterium]